jgi:hypothetical protein
MKRIGYKRIGEDRDRFVNLLRRIFLNLNLHGVCRDSLFASCGKAS